AGLDLRALVDEQLDGDAGIEPLEAAHDDWTGAKGQRLLGDDPPAGEGRGWDGQAGGEITGGEVLVERGVNDPRERPGAIHRPPSADLDFAGMRTLPVRVACSSPPSAVLDFAGMRTLRVRVACFGPPSADLDFAGMRTLRVRVARSSLAGPAGRSHRLRGPPRGALKFP